LDIALPRRQVDRTLEGDMAIFDCVRRRQYGELRLISRALSNVVDHVCQVAW